MSTQLPPFVPGLALSRELYGHVAPVLAGGWPGLAYAAGLLGPGSDVLGFDTAQSRDHAWGPRLLLFLRPDDLARHGTDIDWSLRVQLPATIGGYPVDLAWNHHPDGPPPGGDGVDHRVTLHTVPGFLTATLGVDATRPLAVGDWLRLPEQLLRSITGGAVFRDDFGELTAARERLATYPHDVWLAFMAAAWARIGEEEPFPGRAAQAGDELGSRVVAARLVREIMRLCFLMERVYAPYSKWLGTAFSRLDCAAELEPWLLQALAATDWTSRERALMTALSEVAKRHNALGLTEPLSTEPRSFFDRPFAVIGGERFELALRARIRDPQVAAWAAHWSGIDQWIDSTAWTSYPDRLARLRPVFDRRDR